MTRTRCRLSRAGESRCTIGTHTLRETSQVTATRHTTHGHSGADNIGTRAPSLTPHPHLIELMRRHWGRSNLLPPYINEIKVVTTFYQYGQSCYHLTADTTRFPTLRFSWYHRQHSHRAAAPVRTLACLSPCCIPRCICRIDFLPPVVHLHGGGPRPQRRRVPSQGPENRGAGRRGAALQGEGGRARSRPSASCFPAQAFTPCAMPLSMLLQRATYALVCETLKFKAVIDEVLQLANLTKLIKVWPVLRGLCSAQAHHPLVAMLLVMGCGRRPVSRSGCCTCCCTTTCLGWASEGAAP